MDDKHIFNKETDSEMLAMDIVTFLQKWGTLRFYYGYKDCFKQDNKVLFIDASKGNNINFFEKYKKNLSNDGVIITDNLLFHGLVDDESLIKTKNQRGIVKKIRAFRDFLDNNLEFDTEYVLVGDGISISKRRSSNE